MDYVRHFDRLAATDVSLAGGKGANLGELARAGFPVPPGFVLTAGAYQDFVAANEIQHEIEAALREADPGDPAALERAAALIAIRFARGEIPPEIAGELCRAYAVLESERVAVRSSATTEDLPVASFAGQMETFLNVTGEEAVLEAVKRCWAGLWTARAIAYRARQRVPHEGIALAIVVQQMVDAEMAGVLFTANPVTGDPDEMVVNVAPDPGEAVVSGEVKPEEIVVDRRTRAVRRRAGAPRRFLSVDQATDLVHLGERIEAHYGHPQDIEWAWADGRFHILQARPITTPLRPQPAWVPPDPGCRYIRGGAMELMPGTVSVLFETLGLPALERAIKAYQQHLGLGRVMQDWGFVVINGHVYGRIRPGPRMMLAVLLSLSKLLRRAALLSRTAGEWEQETLPAYRQAVASLRGDPAALPAQALLDRMEAAALACGRYWSVFATMVPQLERSERRFTLLYRKLARKRDPEAAVSLRGLENRQLEAERALYAAREGDLATYVARYGHVLYSLDFAVPPAGKDRAGLLAMQRAWDEGVPSPDERHARLAAEREAAARQVRGRLPGWLRRLFDRTLAAAQQAARIRENALFDLGLAWIPLRRCALELGRRWVKAGGLAEAEQIFWLRHDELKAGVEKLERGEQLPHLAEEAASRRKEREALRGVQLPFSIPEKKAAGFKMLVPTAGARRQAQGNVLTGTATSPGQVRAVARVIHSPEAFDRLGRGEILVAHATTPAWTPLFALAGGLVADLGGALSHGSIVAREYGIPAVMGTGNGTERIHDGQVVTVDGTEGRVTLHG